jgi:E3 ubiquitin-protein ligase MARCH6
LREQILTGGGPAWLQPIDPEPARQPAAAAPPPLEVNVIAPIDALPQDLPPPPPAPTNDEQPVPQLELEHEEGAYVDAEGDEDDDNDEDDDDDDGDEEPAINIAPPVAIAGNAPNQEHNHNWIDWDRAADDLTWERLLGLDGSLQFLEHVFWVVTLNTLFILIFAYAPYHLGKIVISSKTFRQTIADTRFTTPINTLTTYGCVSALIGYIFISFTLLITFTILSFVNYLTRIRRFVGLAYIVLKVALLVILEILLFPFICGIWLDVCSLRILNERTITLNDRLIQFQISPGTSTFLHWLCGMVFVFYFATFIFLLREVLRPGALWFLKSINDLDFNPIQEMIQLPLALHLRRFATSIIIFGCVIILIFFVPGELLIRCIPKFLPFNVKGSLETVVSELMIEFILLQGILPTLLEQGHTRTMLKYLLQLWVELAAWILGLRSFLLGDSPSPSITNTALRVDQNDNVLPMPLVVVPDQAQNNHIEQAPPPVPPPIPTNSSSQAFIEPSFFRLRLCGLCLFTFLSLTFLSILGLTIPATIGRYLLGFITGSARLHELYTILTGLYILWLISRIIFFIRSLLPFDISNMLTRLKSYSILCLRVILCTFCLIGYVPFMIGLASELVLIIPLSTSIEQTAVLTPLRVWIIGLLNTKIAIALIMSGPQWRLKTVLERLYQDGLRRIDFSYLIHEFLFPFTLNIGMFMAFPYLSVSYMGPIFFQSTIVHQIERYIYSAIISLMLLLAFVIFQIKQLRLLFEHVRDEKYLVGRRLINFER